MSLGLCVAGIEVNGGLGPVSIISEAFLVGIAVVVAGLPLVLTTLMFCLEFPLLPRRFLYRDNSRAFSEIASGLSPRALAMTSRDESGRTGLTRMRTPARSHAMADRFEKSLDEYFIQDQLVVDFPLSLRLDYPRFRLLCLQSVWRLSVTRLHGIVLGDDLISAIGLEEMVFTASGYILNILSLAVDVFKNSVVSDIDAR